MPGDLTLEQATQLQQDLICGYSTNEFQRRLREAWNSSEDIVERTRLKMEVCLEVQGPVLERYGFEASRKGVQQSAVAFRRRFNQDPTVAYNNEIMQRLVDPEGSWDACQLEADAPQAGTEETEEERRVREERERQERDEEQRAREREEQAREWQEFARRRRAEEERRRKERERRWRLEEEEEEEEEEQETAPAAGLPAQVEEEVQQAQGGEDEEARYLSELVRQDLLKIEAAKAQQGDPEQEPCVAEAEQANLCRRALAERQEERRRQRATAATPQPEAPPEWEDPTDAFCRRQMAGARGRLQDEVARAQLRERRAGELGADSGFALVDEEETGQEVRKEEQPSMGKLLAIIDREEQEDREFEAVKHLLPGLSNRPPPEVPEPMPKLLPLEDRAAAHRSVEPGAAEARAEWCQAFLEEENERFRQKREAQERLLKRRLREQGKDTFVEAAPRNLKIGGTTNRAAQLPSWSAAGVPEQPGAAGHHSLASGSHGAGKRPPGAQRHRPAEQDPARSADRREWMAKQQERLRQRRLEADAQQSEAAGAPASGVPPRSFAWRRGKEKGVLAEEAAEEEAATQAEDVEEEVIDLE